jgi:hypothetical protein
MYTSSFKLVRVDESYLKNPGQILRQLFTNERVHLANQRHIGAIPDSMRDIMCASSDKVRFIILNDFVQIGANLLELPPKMFQFCSIYKNGLGYSVLDIREAIKPGNFFLCLSHEHKDIIDDPDADVIQRSEPVEYKYHVSIEETRRFHTRYPAYVNLDRSSDNIGGSSWSGNIVSWFRAGPTTRLQYGVQAGLFPEENG